MKDAPFLIEKGVGVPLYLGGSGSFKNGSFEEAKGDKFAGFSQDGPGTTTFVDREVFAAGKQSLRMQDAPGNCRVIQYVSVRRWACYRLSAKVKTKGLKPCDFRLNAIGKGGRGLAFHDAHLKPDQDWTETDVVFNSLDNSEVSLYLGVWGGLKGTLWLDDCKLEELSLVNVLRRPACPLAVTSQDGKTVYEEGKDFEPVKDAKLGVVPYAGEYDFRHIGAAIKLTPGSRIKEADLVLVSWYHPVVVIGFQVACSLSDPKVFDILADQAKRVNDLFRPKTFFMSHDEIRVTGWCKDAEASGKTPGKRLAENVARCAAILKEVAPAARVAVWSDMFDPSHNAKEGPFYLVNGPLTGSWEGLPKDVIVANWNGGHAAESLKFFAGRGYQQVIAGYYDTADFGRGFTRWDEAAAGVPGVRGFMYTTWKQGYGKLDDYGKAMGRK